MYLSITSDINGCDDNFFDNFQRKMKLYILLALPVAALATGGLVGAPSTPGSPQNVDSLSGKHKEIVDFAFSQLTGGAVGSVNGLGSDACKKKAVRVENFTTQVIVFHI